MKYRQLTKEQFEELHEEFARFLASQKVDVKEWNQIKENNPKLAEDEMNIFSDVVWEEVLTKTHYLEHFSKKSINLFKCDEEQIHRILIKVNREDVNLLEASGYDWLIKNPKDRSVEYFKATKTYGKERNLEIFELIEKGSAISNGEMYNLIFDMIS